MVNRLASLFVLIPLLWCLTTPAGASGTLLVEPDRERLYEGEVLTLNVKGTTKIDISLSNLFDFDTSKLPKPDIEKVEENFEILGQKQSYSISTVNGEMMGEVTWTYQLAPRKPGKLTIPSLSFQDAVSDPVTIEVIDGNVPEQADSQRDSFIELSADKDSVYVQEQFVLTVKLFFTGNMVRGELTEPQHPNAIIESLGKQSEYNRYRNGVRYRVVERRYAVFPQKPGELNLPPIRFEGQVRDASGRLRFLRDSKKLFAVPVRNIPDEFTGKTWLPASELSLSESGLPKDPAIETGQNLSRSLSIVAEGLPAEALAPFDKQTPDGLRAYPENPVRTTVPTETGLTAKLSQTFALVPVKNGRITLPEIRIPWWDTKTDSQEFAVIPARTLVVQGAESRAKSPAGENQIKTTDSDGADTPQTTAETDPVEAHEVGIGIWSILVIILSLGWAATALGWWYSRRTATAGETPKNNGDESEKALFKALCQSARAGAPETPDHLIRWVDHMYPQRAVVSLADAYRLLANETIERKIGQLQARNYSQGTNELETWQGETLIEALSEYRDQLASKPEARGALPSLYPQELGSR